MLVLGIYISYSLQYYPIFKICKGLFEGLGCYAVTLMRVRFDEWTNSAVMLESNVKWDIFVIHIAPSSQYMPLIDCETSSDRLAANIITKNTLSGFKKHQREVLKTQKKHTILMYIWMHVCTVCIYLMKLMTLMRQRNSGKVCTISNEMRSSIIRSLIIGIFVVCIRYYIRT